MLFKRYATPIQYIVSLFVRMFSTINAVFITNAGFIFLTLVSCFFIRGRLTALILSFKSM